MREVSSVRLPKCKDPGSKLLTWSSVLYSLYTLSAYSLLVPYLYNMLTGHVPRRIVGHEAGARRLELLFSCSAALFANTPLAPEDSSTRSTLQACRAAGLPLPRLGAWRKSFYEATSHAASHAAGFPLPWLLARCRACEHASFREASCDTNLARGTCDGVPCGARMNRLLAATLSTELPFAIVAPSLDRRRRRHRPPRTGGVLHVSIGDGCGCSEFLHWWAVFS